MATIAPGLNFRIGADVKGINKAIREAERSLKGAVSSFSSIGNSLSLALSVPIAAFTGLSIKAAGEMEAMRFALEGTMKGAGRSVDEARMELEALRKAALAPGLDFEQAVKGSVRLQSVGKSAEEAREIIVQLANALALSGGTAEGLDGVTRQFTQMIGKGKIMQEDLTIILENMPALAKVMQDTFGTTNAEMLRKMGVSVEDFIGRLTTGMKDLPRAQGGIANSIVNAQNAIKQAIADVGTEINKAFNITGALDTFSGWVTGIAKWFKDLDEDTKRLIGSFVVFAAVLGPAFKVMQAGVFVVGKMQVAFLALQRALALSQTEGGITGLIGKWRALDTVMKASIIGAIAAVVLAAAAAFAVLQKDMSAAAQAARAVEEVNKTAGAAIAEEKTKVELLVGTLKSNTATLQEKKGALKELQAISPQYFGNLDIEKSKITDIDTALNSYVANLLRAAKAKAAFDQIVEIEKKLQNLAEVAEPTFWQKVGDGIMSMGSSARYAFEQGKTLAGNMTEQKAALEAQKVALQDVIKQNSELGTATKAVTSATKEATAAIKEQKEVLSGADFAKPENFGALPTLQMPGELAPMNDPLKGLADSAIIATSAMQEHLTVMGQAALIYKQIQDGIGGLSTSMQAMASGMLQSGNLMGAVFTSMGAAFAEAGEKGAASMGELAAAAVAAAAKVIKTYIQMAVTRAALSALQGLPFPINLAAAAAAGGIASALFSNLIKAVGIPALAEGGVVKHPTAVMVGEYMGARTNPEIIAPESKMRDVFSDVLRRSGGMGGGRLVARVEGKDLLFVLEEAQTDAARRRGR